MKDGSLEYKTLEEIRRTAASAFPDELLRQVDLAHYLECTTNTVQNWGKQPTHKIGKIQGDALVFYYELYARIKALEKKN